MGAYIFLLERNRKRLIQMLHEEWEDSDREREKHYAERDEERQEQEDKDRNSSRNCARTRYSRQLLFSA